MLATAIVTAALTTEGDRNNNSEDVVGDDDGEDIIINADILCNEDARGGGDASYGAQVKIASGIDVLVEAAEASEQIATSTLNDPLREEEKAVRGFPRFGRVC